MVERDPSTISRASDFPDVVREALFGCLQRSFVGLPPVGGGVGWEELCLEERKRVQEFRDYASKCSALVAKRGSREIIN